MDNNISVLFPWFYIFFRVNESLKYPFGECINMKTPEKRGTPAQGNSQSVIVGEIVEKLKERQAISKQKYLLAQKDTQEEAFWDGHVDALEVAIIIVESEDCEE